MDLQDIQDRECDCRLCPRLVAWREAAGKNPPLRHRGETYWSRPAPSFGDPLARLVIVGLAPAAQGANRTGRMFTGDRSGDWLFRALWRAGFANQPTSVHRDDGLSLHDCFITAACHCAPPLNKPLPEELANCRPFLHAELRALTNMKILLGLGKIGFDAAFSAAREVGFTTLKKRPAFGHGATAELRPGLHLIGTYHPSQQNTFTGRLTEAMFDAVFTQARQHLQSHEPQ